MNLELITQLQEQVAQLNETVRLIYETERMTINVTNRSRYGEQPIVEATIEIRAA